MITSAYALTATERVLPRMALDFTTAVLDSRVTVTRALNTATRVNSSGLVEIINADLPRFDYDPVTLAPKGLLIEETRANILTNSENFSAVTYATLRGTISTNTTAAPDSQQTADSFTEDSTANTRATQIASAFSVTNAAPYALSVFLKNGDTNGNGRRYVSLIIVDNSTGANGYLATFDLVAGTYTTQNRGTGSITAAKMEPFNDGWYRCSITGNMPSSFILFYISPATNATPTQGGFGRENYTGDGLKFFYLWGAQFEAGAFPTSYIPTQATSLTRNADVVEMTGTNFSDWYNASAGSWFIQTNARNSDTVLTAGGFTLTADATALKKYADAYSSDQSASSLVLGNGTVAKVSYYKQALLAAELQALKA
jgi:hypothetical protein